MYLAATQLPTVVAFITSLRVDPRKANHRFRTAMSARTSWCHSALLAGKRLNAAAPFRPILLKSAGHQPIGDCADRLLPAWYLIRIANFAHWRRLQ
jgi:hypothetical protein